VGSIACSFEDRFGFDAIFCAIGFSVVVDGGVVVVVPVGEECFVDEAVDFVGVVVFPCEFPCDVCVVVVVGFDVGALGRVVVRCGLPPCATGGFPLDAPSGATPSDRAMTPAGIVRTVIGFLRARSAQGTCQHSYFGRSGRD
jgi:hypothetical protein